MAESRAEAAAGIPKTQELHDIRLTDLLMAWYRRYVEKHFERAFVVLTIVALLGIGYFIENKLAFINFFYIPVFFAAYVLNTRTAVLGSVFSMLVVFLYAVIDPSQFFVEPTNWNLFSHLLAWGSFLVLTGALVGRLNEKVNDRYHKAETLVGELQNKQEQLEKLQKDLIDSNSALDLKNRTIEALKEKVEAVLYSTMDPEVARLVVNRQIVTEKKLVTVLFADLQGFTPYAEARQPEVVIEELNKYFNIVEPVISRFRGHLDKYIGDGLMAEFGVPLFFQRHALMGVLGALQIRDRTIEAHLPLKVRLGISTGTAIVGLLGSERRKSYSAVGDAVNLAQRLEVLCPAGSILVDDATYQKVARFVKARKLRMGLEDEVTERLEQRLAELQKEIKAGSANGEQWFEAGQTAASLGEMQQAVPFYKEALKILPQRKDEIERALLQAVLMEEERAKIEVKGKKLRVTAYEILGIADPLEDANKFTPGFAKRYAGLQPRLQIAPDAIQSIEAIDGTLGQSRSTALLSYAIAEALNADGELKETVLMAGYLHHVGKRYIPEHLLNREDADYDLQVMTGHVNEAPKVISELGLQVSEDVLRAIHHHHEVYGGGGYPAGLKGEDIPLSSRIVQVASQFDTLTAWKSHRDAWNRKSALSEMRREADLGRYDPKVVKALCSLFDAA